MASKQIDFVSDAIVNRTKRGCFDNTFEDVSACTKLLLEATKFDDANVMPSPSADSKFVLSLLKLFKHAQFIVYTQNHFGILKS